MSPNDLEVKVWPPDRGGMSVHRCGPGVYMLHRPSGLGVIVTCERTMQQNRQLAELLMAEVLGVTSR